jgi:NifB/MoaA-like Fe-S oxidoreductase
VVCPGVNDGPILEETLLDCLDRFGALASVAVVPLGLSKFSEEARMRPHSVEEAVAVLDVVERVSDAGVRLEGRRRLFASDEYYLMAHRAIPPVAYYQDVDQLENGIGLAAQFLAEVSGAAQSHSRSGGFFQSVDGAPPWGYRAERSALSSPRLNEAPILLTGEFGASILRLALAILGREDISIREVANTYFAGTVAVAGLLTAEDLIPVLKEDLTARWVLPDVCLNEGRFLDGASLADLPCEVEIVATTGTALAELLASAPALQGAH